MNKQYSWARYGGYECSSKGDIRFSALYAKMPDGRTIEQWYQCDIKGYDIGGTNWRLGKGKPPRYGMAIETQYDLYKSLWLIWLQTNAEAFADLRVKADEHNGVLSDMFATSSINQARVLAELLNEQKEPTK